MQKNDFDVKKIRKEFPIFTKLVHNKSLVYFDSASTAQMPQMVADAMMEYYVTYKANVGRGLYFFAEKATQKFQDARENIAQFIGAKNEEIVVTSGTTAGINFIVHSWAQSNIFAGDEIIVSQIEHHSNFVPWQQFALRTGAILKIAPVNESGVVAIETLKTYLSPKTKLVAIVHTSNILGTTNDVTMIAKEAHKVGAKILIDAAQSIAHQKIDVEKLECDFLVFSGHKLFGPTGIGILFIKKDLFESCALSSFGGGMVFSSDFSKSEFKHKPYCFEAGTQPIAQMIGLSAAVDFIKAKINFQGLQKHETNLVLLGHQELRKLSTIEIISPLPISGQHSALITFLSSKYHAHDIASFLDQEGIAVRAGHHCVQPYYKELGIRATVRFSFSVYNSEEEVLYGIQKLAKML
ncbi:SufS family cysteine desulfurase [Candidatus Dependentiae bacterium]|nr:SufS family cysteine desulfurase [Candidatus Dependentiae bacterium]